MLAALMLHGSAFALFLTLAPAPRQEPMPAGAAVPVTLYTGVQGQATIAAQASAPPAPAPAPQAAAEIQPAAPEPDPQILPDPPKPVSIAPAPHPLTKAKKKISHPSPQARRQTQPQAAQPKGTSRGASTGGSGKATTQSLTRTAGTGTEGLTGNAVIPARPRYRDNPAPVYPELARRRQMEGTVVLEVLVNTRGRVERLRVAASSGHSLLDNAALRAVRTWRFVPGKKGTVPVTMAVRVPVRFDLR